MLITFQLYRKAIAALIGGLLPLLASIAPGISDYLDPMTANVLSVVLATLAATATANKIDGANVIELARVVVDALDRIDDRPGGDANPAPGVAQSVLGRKDGLTALITATPLEAAKLVPETGRKAFEVIKGDHA